MKGETHQDRDRVLQQEAEEFARQAEQKAQGFVRELWNFMRHEKKWWMLPLIVTLLLAGLLIVIGGSSAGSAIYTLF